MLEASVQLRTQRDQRVANELSQTGNAECGAGALNIAYQRMLVAENFSLSNQSGVHDVSHFVVIQSG